MIDWDLDLEYVDEELSVREGQQIIRKRIAHWAVESNVSRDSVNSFLAVFRTDPNVSFLPKAMVCTLPLRGIEVAPINNKQFVGWQKMTRKK